MAFIAVSLLLAMTLIGGGIWLLWQRTATVRAVGMEMREAARLQQESAWAEAGAALERAMNLLGQGGPVPRPCMTAWTRHVESCELVAKAGIHPHDSSHSG